MLEDGTVRSAAFQPADVGLRVRYFSLPGSSWADDGISLKQNTVFDVRDSYENERLESNVQYVIWRVDHFGSVFSSTLRNNA